MGSSGASPTSTGVVGGVDMATQAELNAIVPVRDTAANLAANNTVYAAGLLIIATDTRVLAFGDGATAYNSLSKYPQLNMGMVQSAQTTTPNSTIPTTGQDWSGLTITLVADGVTAIKLHARCYASDCSAAGSKTNLSVYEGATLLGSDRSPAAYTAGAITGGLDAWSPPFVPTAGSHTYKVQSATTTAGTSTNYAAASGQEAFIESVLVK